MSSDEDGGGPSVSGQQIALVGLGLILVMFAVIPEYRPLVFLVGWLLGPVAAFGALVQVFRGVYDLRSAKGITLSLLCGSIAFIAIPLGFVVVPTQLSDALQFGGFLAALCAVGFAKLALTEKTVLSDRDVPPIDESVDLDALRTDQSESIDLDALRSEQPGSADLDALDLERTESDDGNG